MTALIKVDRLRVVWRGVCQLCDAPLSHHVVLHADSYSRIISFSLESPEIILNGPPHAMTRFTTVTCHLGQPCLQQESVSSPRVGMLYSTRVSFHINPTWGQDIVYIRGWEHGFYRVLGAMDSREAQLDAKLHHPHLRCQATRPSQCQDASSLSNPCPKTHNQL